MAQLLYRLFLRLFLLATALLSPFNLKARQWLKGRHGWRKWWARHLHETGINPQDTVIWMHAASLGEFEQGAPVLEAVKQMRPEAKIIVTFFSPSGYEVRKHYPGAHLSGYLPFDHPWHSAAFVRMIHPSLVLWVKYDYWFFTLKAIQKQNIPLLLVSGIFLPNQVYFKWYGALHRQMLNCFTHFFLQNTLSRDLIAPLIPAEKISISGDTRFDRVDAIAKGWQAVEGIEAWLGGVTDVVVAGSTWPSDEEELVHYFKTRKEVKLILAPHSVDPHMLEATLKLYPEALLYSTLMEKSAAGNHISSQILLIDNVGMLSRLYRYGRIAYVGGGFTGTGVHNVLEAAVYGIPVVHGPEYEKYAEAIGLEEAGGSKVIESAIQLEATFNELFHRPQDWEKCGQAASDYVIQHTGATRAIVNYIQENRLATS